MADFIYIVRTKDGIRKEGKIESKNYNSAREELISDGMTIIKLTERDTSFDFLGPFLDRFNLAVDRFKNRIPLDILVFFTRQLSTMFSAIKVAIEVVPSFTKKLTLLTSNSELEEVPIILELFKTPSK